MKISDIKKILPTLDAVNFRLPNGTRIPAHFHVTEIGLIDRHFIDCGGTQRHDKKANFQLWVAGDHDHRLAPQKLLRILDISAPILGTDDLEIEVEYQQTTIGKFGLAFDGTDFILTVTQTACLAQDACGIPDEKLPKAAGACAPGGGCC
jgi:hypothetical protein